MSILNPDVRTRSAWLSLDQAASEARRTATDLEAAIARGELRAATVGGLTLLHEAWVQAYVASLHSPEASPDYRMRAAHDDSGDAA